MPEKKDRGDESSDAADFEKEDGKNMLSKMKVGTGQESRVIHNFEAGLWDMHAFAAMLFQRRITMNFQFAGKNETSPLALGATTWFLCTPAPASWCISEQTTSSKEQFTAPFVFSAQERGALKREWHVQPAIYVA